MNVFRVGIAPGRVAYVMSPGARNPRPCGSGSGKSCQSSIALSTPFRNIARRVGR